METPNDQNSTYEQENIAAAIIVESLSNYYKPLVQTGKSIPVVDGDIAAHLKIGLEKDVQASKLESNPQSVKDQLDSYELSGISADQLHHINIAVKEELIRILESEGLDGFLMFTG